MLDRRGYRESIGKQNGKIGVRILLALPLVAAMGFAIKLYIVQEILVVLILLAVSTVTILTLAVAFILIQAAVRWAVLCAKPVVEWLAGLGPQDQRYKEPMVGLLPTIHNRSRDV